MKSLIVCTILMFMSSSAYGVLAGGRPNSISGGINAFAGVVNPANAVWIEDRFDIGGFWVWQKSSLNNVNNNPLFTSGKIDTSYHAHTLFTMDVAVHKRVKLCSYESSFTLAAYTTPSYVKVGTKQSIPIIGTTPIRVLDKVQVISGVFSVKLNACHSAGFSIDYFYPTHRRNGFQASDNRLRSVSPGNVTNNGFDHSNGVGLSLGWRWDINEALTFGAAFVKKSYIGQYRKYRGYEPHHGKNYIPETIGAGFTYKFTKQIAGRLEVIWTNLGNLPNANNNILPDGSLNLHKRGSNKSPGPGLQDATFINMGIGYKVNSMLAVGAGYSRRIKLPRRTSNILSHTYTFQTIYDLLAFGVDFRYEKHDFFLSFAHGFENRVSGYLPKVLRGGKFIAKKSNNALSIAWGYLF
jgi:long-chain fatty acid transport protein